MSTPARMEAGESAGLLLPRIARGLSLAAAPTFAVMAVVSVGAPADMICSGMGNSVLSGMAAMYGLMSLFHAGVWLRWIDEGGLWRF
jgi:hypothetical protein